jgi:Tol biopolymer transport system component
MKNKTTKQIVMVAKDRAIDELYDLTGDGYWNRSAKDRSQIRKIAKAIAMPDGKSIAALKSWINGEEYMFFEKHD